MSSGLFRRVQARLEALADRQAARPWQFVGVAVLLAALSVPLVLQLGLEGNFTALLPESKPAVRAFEAFTERVGIASNLSIAIHGDDIQKVRALTRDLAQSLEKDPPPEVASVDWNLGSLRAFVEKNKYLYADYEDIERVRDIIQERIDYEKVKANPLFMDLGDEPEDPREYIETLEEKDNRYTAILGDFPEGYLQHPKLPLTVMFVRTTVKGGDIPHAEALLAEVQRRVDLLRPGGLAQHGLSIDFGGDMMDVLVETQSLQREIAIATTATIVLVLFAVYVFFLSVRAIPLLGLTLVTPVLMTFGIAELTVDYLNTSTAFLGSIVIGNGINPNIIWLARYFELRRSGYSVRDAVAATHTGTVNATITASAAAGLAYASLVSTDFRGFRDFGTIGGVGMLLCWSGAYLLLPALAVLFDRWRPVPARPEGSAHRNIYGTALAWLALRAPRVTVLASLVVTVVAGVLVYRYIAADPFEYDYRRLQSHRDPDSRIQWVNDRQGEIVTQSVTGSAIAVLTDSSDDARTVRTALEDRRDELGAYGTVLSLDMLEPARQAEKLELLREIRATVGQLRPHMSDDDWKVIEQNLPPADLAPITIADLPSEAMRMFAEVDGSRGRIVYVESKPGENTWDGQYLVRWSEAVRSVGLPDNRPAPVVAGNATVFADLLDSILVDGPKAVFAAFMVTTVLVLLGFRAWRERLLTWGTLMLGILWMVATMAIAGIRLNFLNFVSFPITLGNGVDYGVNVMQRTVQEEESGVGRVEAVRRAVEATGGAVILCSATTIIGYISLYMSSNQALNSFGTAMAISELTCIGTAGLAMPALNVLSARRARAAAPAAEADAERVA